MTTPHLQKLLEKNKNEVLGEHTKPFQSKGYGLFIALIILIVFFWTVPIMLKLCWPVFLDNLSPPAMIFLLAMSFHTGSHAIANIGMYFIYRSKHPFFERYKISDKPWPWESQPELWREILKKTFKILAITHFIIVPIILFIETRNEVKMRIDFESFPNIEEIIQQLIFFTFVEDFLFYWAHRLLHHPKLYPYVHKVHHEYNIVISLAAEYAHPIEFLVSNAIPYNVGPKLLGKNVHFATYLIWVMLAQFETADQHSGYEFSWSPFRLIPLCGSATYHEFHHSYNKGNFTSLFTFWDTLCGTNIEYLKYVAAKRKKKIDKLIKESFHQMKEEKIE